MHVMSAQSRKSIRVCACVIPPFSRICEFSRRSKISSPVAECTPPGFQRIQPAAFGVSAVCHSYRWTMNVLFDGSYKSKPLVSLGGSHKNVSQSTPYAYRLRLYRTRASNTVAPEAAHTDSTLFSYQAYLSFS